MWQKENTYRYCISWPFQKEDIFGNASHRAFPVPVDMSRRLTHFSGFYCLLFFLCNGHRLPWCGPLFVARIIAKKRVRVCVCLHAHAQTCLYALLRVRVCVCVWKHLLSPPVQQQIILKHMLRLRYNCRVICVIADSLNLVVQAREEPQRHFPSPRCAPFISEGALCLNSIRPAPTREGHRAGTFSAGWLSGRAD